MSINAGAGGVFANQPIPAFKVDSSTLVDDQILVFDSIEQAFVNTANTNNTTVTATPSAPGTEIFVSAVDGVLTFKNLVAGAGVTITDTGTALNISADPSNQISASNLGSGEGIFESKNGFELRFKSINEGIGSKHLQVTSTSNEVQIQTLAEINTGVNTGTGIGNVFRGKTGETLEFKTIHAGGDLSITDTPDDIYIQSNYTLTPNQLVVGDTFEKLKTLANGNTGSVLKVGANGLEWSEVQSQNYTFRVTFEQDGGVDTADQLPTGWTTNITGNLITVTHTVGKPLKDIVYWGYDSVTQNLRFRQPTGTHQVTIPAGEQNTKFAINVISQVAGAEVNGYANIVVQF